MNDTLTAEQFYVQKKNYVNVVSKKQALELMREFAKLHVQAALEAAAENAEAQMPKWDLLDVWTVDKKSILEAYPLDRII